MPTSRNLGELFRREVYNLPARAANPSSDYAEARQREEWMLRRERDAEVAREEADLSLAILTVASEIDFSMLEYLDHTTQDAILDVRAATPGALLTELAVRHMRKY